MSRTSPGRVRERLVRRRPPVPSRMATHLLFAAVASLLSFDIYLHKSLPCDPTRDFAAVAMVCEKGPIVVQRESGFSGPLTELIAYGSKPRELSYAVHASRGFAIRTARLLNKRGGIGMLEVADGSSPQMAQDTMVGPSRSR